MLHQKIINLSCSALNISTCSFKHSEFNNRFLYLFPCPGFSPFTGNGLDYSDMGFGKVMVAPAGAVEKGREIATEQSVLTIRFCFHVKGLYSWTGLY